MKKRVVWITAVVACLLLCFVLAGCAEQTAYENMINNSQTQQGQTGLNDHTTEQTRPGQSGNGTQGQSQAIPEPGNEQPGQSHDTTGQTQQDNQPSQPQTPAEDPAALDFNFEERAGGGYAVTSYKGTAKTVTIPSTYKGKNVVTIGTSKMDGITRIADGMTNSYDVEEIIIPDTVRAIGFGAFAYCVSLKEIHIPNVAKIDASAFLNCTNLTKITIDGGVLDINTFKGCERVKEIILGQNVTGIKSELFAECTSLERLTLPDIEANTFGALFKRVYFTYNGDLVPETTVSGRYNYNGSSYIYNKPADNTNWLMPTRVTTWQGQQVVWDGNPAVTTGNYKTVTLVLNETCRVPTSGSFYGYTVPQTLETVTMTSPTCACASKFTGCSFINVILPHTFAETWSTSDTQHWHAATCGHDLKADVENHNWGEWVVTKAPTCTETGSRKHTCTVCGKAVSERIAMTTEHTYATTWSADETQHWHAATCGHELKTDVANHNWGEWVVTKAPTCTETGAREHACTVCGQTMGETMQATGHTYNADNICTACGEHKYLTFTLSNGTYSVKGKDNTISTAVIPSTYNGLPVAGIAYEGFSGYSSLRSVTIPDSVTSIGDAAFYNCTGLTSVTIPNSVTSIGESAFYGCTGLTSITIGNGVRSIGGYAFSGCTGLTSITIGNGVRSIGSYTFSGCTGLKSITIPDSVTSIGKNAFSNCTKLTSITIGNGVTSIGSGAFSGCSSLVSITIPFVGGKAGKTANDTYQYPFGYIFGTNGYTGGTSTTQYYYGSSTSDTANTTYYIPATLRSVTVTGGNILCGAFYGCERLTSVTIGNGVTSIGNSAFYNCTGLTSITIPDSVTSIGKNAFSNCTKLTSITIGNGVTSIGSGAFSGCSSLVSITIPFVGGKAGKTANDRYQYPFGYIFGTSSYTGGTAIRQYYYGSSTSSTTETIYYIPTTLRSITVTGGNILYGAFQNCTALTSVTIGNGVTSIGDSAFYNCTGLTSITIPDSVTSIGKDAFKKCTGLTSVTIPGSVTSIGQRAFYNCTGLTSITIGNGVTSIGDSAFYNCTGLTSITIPDSVTSIGQRAFYNCTGLTSITFTGTKAQWNAINKGSDWNYNTGAYTIHCTDGDIAKQ